MSKNKLAGIIVACTVAIIVAIILFISEPWEGTPSAETYTLTTHISPSGAGSISPSGGEYESGVQVTLRASPAGGYTFDHWSGDASSTSAVIVITIDSDKDITACFEEEPPATFGPIVITGTSDAVSPPFEVSTQEWIIDWSYVPDYEYPQYAAFGFFVYPRGETVMYVASLGYSASTSGSTYSYAGPGEYYAEVICANIESWEITIKPP